jgi:transposase-like protein
MRKFNYYSDDFKRTVVHHYLTSNDSMEITAKKFKITSYSSIMQWVRKLGGEFRTSEMNNSPEKPKTEHPNTPEEMALRIKELEQALERERLMNLATNKLIDVAERDLNISIRKKSGAKQSKK